MAEAITEMIIPGTYIEVRAEGLIGVSGVATGNVGVVGTAAKGPIGQVVVLSSFSEGRETFGEYDAWAGGSSSELTLVRTLQQLFDNGASTVYAVRCAATGAAAASRTVEDATGAVAKFEAKTKGTWGHDVTVQVKVASAPAFVEERTQTVGPGDAVADLHKNIASSLRNEVKVVKGDTGQTHRLKLATSGSTAAGRAVVDANGKLTFVTADQPKEGDKIVASYEVDVSACRDIVIAYGNTKETYTVVDGTDILRDVNVSSGLVEATIAPGAEPRVPKAMDEALPLTGGGNGEGALAADYATTLSLLDPEQVNIVTLGGQTFSDAESTLLAHVEGAENNGRDRIAVVGADTDELGKVSENAGKVSDDRLILVAPGIRAKDLVSGADVALDASYAAAAVAGVIASLAVQVSPTNKVLRVSGLTTDYNDGELKKLLTSRVMPLERKAGYRIVQGLTTDGGPFRQVSVRRTVDYAKAGTRIGSLPYIGRLNNARVRGALHATLNGFLSDMVLNEALTTFQLFVTATRAQEIAGTCVVTMFLQPTFSIDYVKVIMNLS